MRQNPGLSEIYNEVANSHNGIFEVLKVKPLHKNKNVYQAIVKVSDDIIGRPGIAVSRNFEVDPRARAPYRFRVTKLTQNMIIYKPRALKSKSQNEQISIRENLRRRVA